MDNGGTCVMDVSPGGTHTWIPECDASLNPFEGQKFDTMENGITFYTTYAGIVGFDVRRSSDKRNKYSQIMKKQVVCSREGFKETKDKETIEEETTKQKRRRTTNRVGCPARFVLTLNKEGKYVVKTFVDRHTHVLCEEKYKRFMKVNRKIDIGHQEFIRNCGKVNVGASKSFDIYAEMVGGPENVGATQQDFKNYRRELLAYMKEKDIQMVISQYLEKKNDCVDMYFEYDVNEKDQLARVFWADRRARLHYGAFGDVVSFDATYKTNRYNLVFVPFTGIDNHKRCVTFAAGLIDKEDVESYSWILRNFKNAMGSTPPIVITDQDPAMKVAIETEFPGTRHRYCMWHIMTKVGDKVGDTLAKNEEFRRALNAVVWNEESTTIGFESAWNEVIQKYGLLENRWLKRMYDERASWVPPFFEDVFMGGLLRTTSRSEAENRIFQSNTNKHLCLVEFFKHFESAVRKQRDKHLELSAACIGQTPPLKTLLRIEREAATVYTLTVFSDVQKEICEGWSTCRVRSYTEAEGVKTYVVEDGTNKRYTVIVEDVSNNTSCTCRLYTRIGLLCRHVFVVLKDERIDHIPPQHITPRWTKEAVKHIEKGAGVRRQIGANNNGHNTTVEGKVINTIYRCLGMARGNGEKMQQITNVIEELEATLCDKEVNRAEGNAKRAVMEAYCGVPEPDTIKVHPPPSCEDQRVWQANEISQGGGNY
ncbi:PREDICTED: protein FAR1-RELATED SEQUENCE 5-like [Ipomoea nil]|uniref:protein FAR1-RELATED SEQUENCE 5-like n=1 Tax=Ipomoea nil TaxID=35883 RepID=UPI0009010FDF|nr:PREDICTED: protein FAR1-RELATED SEQUENCE 5-like [Ipomoea nil]